MQTLQSTLQSILESLLEFDPDSQIIENACICEFSAEDSTPTLHLYLWRGYDLHSLPNCLSTLKEAASGYWDGGRCYSLQATKIYLTLDLPDPAVSDRDAELRTCFGEIVHEWTLNNMILHALGLRWELDGELSWGALNYFNPCK
jgi:hypothetical protein